MEERKAIYYGKIELIPGIVCDGYVLDDPEMTAVLSERGTSDLLNMDHKALKKIEIKGVPASLRCFMKKETPVGTNHTPKTLEPFCDKETPVGTNHTPKTLEPFYDKDLIVRGNYVKVVAKNSPHCGREIVVYNSATIESLIRSYALAFINDGLRQNQIHIGKRAVALLISLIRTALEAAIKEACGLRPEIQKTAQKHYIDVVSIVEELEFRCSLPGKIATKKDICEFLKIPEPTLNSFLRKHENRIHAIKLSAESIKALGSKAKRMNGYPLEEVSKILLGMDTARGIELKQKVLGEMGEFFHPYPQEETNWENALQEVFEGFGFKRHYRVGDYTVDYFISDFGLCLECNGYEHEYYDKKYESQRQEYILKKYALVRFHHKIRMETLFNGILQARKPGDLVNLYAFAKK